MNWQGFRAVVRLELVRGRRLLLWGSGLLLILLVCAMVLPQKAAIIMGVLAFPIVAAMGMAPLGSLGIDKMHGHLEFDRTLPLSLRTIAAARLLGATLRTAPAILGIVAFGIALSGEHAAAAPLVVAIALLAMLVAWWFLWTLLALNARFSMRRLWWLPISIWLVPTLIPDAWLERAGDAMEAFAVGALDRFDGAPLLVLGAVAAITLPTLLLYTGAVALFASGLARYRPDPAALGVPLGAAPKRELAAVGRGPVLAVTRLRLRLALEQFRRELIVVGVLLLVIVLDLDPLASYARMYIPVLAALIPSGIAFQLIAGRASGALEGLQQLPHPRRVIGVGHLLAVMVMALPGVVLLAVARAVEAQPMTPAAILTRWLWYVTLAWVGVVLGVWATRRRMLLVVVAALVVLGAVWFLSPGSSFTDSVLALIANAKTIRESAGVLLPLAVASVAVLGGVALFARGLATVRGQR